MAHANDYRRVVVEPTAEQATRVVAELFRSIICDSVSRHHLCYVALAGGTTPHRLYGILADPAVSEDVPWNKVEIFFGDERDVSFDHVESNYRMVQRGLLDHVPVELPRVHPMPGDAEDLASAAADYERMVRSTVPAGPDALPCFDLILLGMGGDGHTASLFPATEALNEQEKLVVAHFVSVLGRNRMTFTFPLINAARTVIMLVTGADKGQAVADLLGEDTEARRRLPAAGVAPTRGKLVLVLDAAAARRAGLGAR